LAPSRGLTDEFVLFERLCQGNIVEVVECIDGGFQPGVIFFIDEKSVQSLINSLKKVRYTASGIVKLDD
jgi:hypothetical protein